MRYIAFVLSIFILGLSMLPCTDSMGYADDTHMEQHETKGTAHDHEDTCPPFCSCLCCGVVVTAADEEPLCFFMFNPIFVTEFHYSFYYSYQHPSTVWQPPTV